jgi:hypothetical protein
MRALAWFALLFVPGCGVPHEARIAPARERLAPGELRAAIESFENVLGA